MEVGREGLWLERRVLQCNGGEGDRPKRTSGQTTSGGSRHFSCRSFKIQHDLGATGSAALRGKWHSERGSERVSELTSECWKASFSDSTIASLPATPFTPTPIPLLRLLPLFLLPLNLSPISSSEITSCLGRFHSAEVSAQYLSLATPADSRFHRAHTNGVMQSLTKSPSKKGS